MATCRASRVGLARERVIQLNFFEALPFKASRVPVEHLRVVAVTDDGLGNTSWLLDLGDGSALVVDPERDPRPYAATADSLELVIGATAETHLHADFVTGSGELAHHGAHVLASADGHLESPHIPLSDGSEMQAGRFQLRALATPGHTPEHLAYLLLDGTTPQAVFTGGSLLVNAVARTDLIHPDQTEELTRSLWRSLHERLLNLPDDVLVLPTHGAGSFCSASGSSQRWTTIGAERRTNPLLQASDEEDFVRRVLSGFGSYPPYFLRLREVNRRGPTVMGAMPDLKRLSVDEVSSLRETGAIVVDVRSVPRFAEGHIPGSLANTLRGQLASWLGWLVEEPTTPLVFVVDQDQDRHELVRQCLNIGYENLAGELAGGIDAWIEAGGETQTVELLSGADGVDDKTVDVRQDAEFVNGHVPDAVHIELGAMKELASSLPDGHLLMMCGHGERAMTGASVLLASGRSEVSVYEGGPSEWSTATGRELE